MMRRLSPGWRSPGVLSGIAAAVALAVTAPPLGAAPADRGLCAPAESVVFACTTAHGKVVSLCGSADLDELHGTLQYRFGVAGKQPELVYPAHGERAKASFRSGTMMFSGGGGAFLAFANERFRYVVYTGIGKGWEKEGVVVERSPAGGKRERVASLACAGAYVSEIGPDLFERLRIPEDADAAEFEIP